MGCYDFPIVSGFPALFFANRFWDGYEVVPINSHFGEIRANQKGCSTIVISALRASAGDALSSGSRIQRELRMALIPVRRPANDVRNGLKDSGIRARNGHRNLRRWRSKRARPSVLTAWTPSPTAWRLRSWALTTLNRVRAFVDKVVAVEDVDIIEQRG